MFAIVAERLRVPDYAQPMPALLTKNLGVVCPSCDFLNVVAAVRCMACGTATDAAPSAGRAEPVARSQAVTVDLSREAIKNAPHYDSGVAWSRDQELSLYRHYGRHPEDGSEPGSD